MAVGTRKCKSCGDYVREFIVTPKGVFCNYDSAVKWAYKNKSKGAEIKFKAQKKKDTVRKKELMTRRQWYDRLQKEVNYYAKHIKEKGKACCTCGASNKKIDAGHYLSRGARPELRFELTNIHNQCSVNCNQIGSGMRAEYNEYIKDRYGIEHYNWLNGPHQSLKDKFPLWQDIEKEIKRYRKLNKDSRALKSKAA